MTSIGSSVYGFEQEHRPPMVREGLFLCVSHVGACRRAMAEDEIKTFVIDSVVDPYLQVFFSIT